MKLGIALVTMGIVGLMVIGGVGIGGLIKGGHSPSSPLYWVVVVASVIGYGLVYCGVKRMNKTKKLE